MAAAFAASGRSSVRVFLTGGTGLLGSHLAEGFRGAGLEVRALCRPGSGTRLLEARQCEVVRGDVEDAPQLQARRMEGCQALVHAAGVLYGAASMEEARSVNVSGTRKVFLGASLAGVGRGLHVSSVAVYGNAAGPMTEDLPLEHPLPEGDLYGRSKREAEEAVRRVEGEVGIPVTIFRPPALYGERDRYFLPRLVRWLRRPVVPLPGSGRSRLALVYAGNLAAAMLPALDGRGEGAVFNVTEDVSVTLRSLAGGLARELGLRPRFVPIPGILLRAGAGGLEALGLSVPGARGLSPSRAARLVLEDNPYPAEKARRELGWKPPCSLERILARVGAWIRSLDPNTRGSSG